MIFFSFQLNRGTNVRDNRYFENNKEAESSRKSSVPVSLKKKSYFIFLLLFRFYFIFLKTKFKNLRRKAFELLTNRPHAGERSLAITLPELHDSIKKRPPNEKNLSRYSWASADSVQDSLCFSILLGFFLSSRAVPLPRFKLIGPISFFFIARHLRQRIYYYYPFGLNFFF
jgi:hypothetical protein